MDSERADWRDDAACLHANPDLFFPVGTAGPALRQVDRAKRICGTCPVRTPCLAWALDQGILSGVWGGTTEEERRAIRRASFRNGRNAKAEVGAFEHAAGIMRGGCGSPRDGRESPG
jgi:WhiB family redox-sensing transcriptional regulator